MASTHSQDKPGNPVSVFHKGWAMLMLAAALSGTSTSALATGMISPGQTFQLALEAQTAGHYEQMLTLLRSAGAADHLGAQEMLGMALLVGPTLYGDAVKADRCEAGQWIARALAQGSEVARYQWAFLGRVRQVPPEARPCDSTAG
ncbi:MAG: sel1 repeat family protein [Advenella sp.]